MYRPKFSGDEYMLPAPPFPPPPMVKVGSFTIVAAGWDLPGANTSMVDLDTPIDSTAVQPLGKVMVNPSPTYPPASATESSARADESILNTEASPAAAAMTADRLEGASFAARIARRSAAFGSMSTTRAPLPALGVQPMSHCCALPPNLSL